MNPKVGAGKQPQTFAARNLLKHRFNAMGQRDAAREVKGTGLGGMLKGMFNSPATVFEECMDVAQGNFDPVSQTGAGEPATARGEPSPRATVIGMPVNPELAGLVHAASAAPNTAAVGPPETERQVADHDAARVWPHVKPSMANRLRSELGLSPSQSEAVLRETDAALAATGGDGPARISGGRANAAGSRQASAGTWEDRARERLEREGMLSPEQIGQVIQMIGDIIRQGMQQIANTLMEASKSAAANATPSNAGSRS